MTCSSGCLTAPPAVLTWRFRNAFPVVYRLSPLDAAASDLVIETVELAFDSMDVEA